MTILVLGLIVGGVLLLVDLVMRLRARGHPGRVIEVGRARLGLRLAAVACAVLGVLFGAFRVVPGGSVGVQVLFGRIDERPLTEGLNVINPLKQVRLMSVRTQEMFEHAAVLYHLDGTKAPSVYR